MSDETFDDAVVVALGSSLDGAAGSRAWILHKALEGFSEIGLVVKAKSSLWRSAAWPDPLQPDFLNAVVVGRSALGPASLLSALHGLEARFGRRREAVNGPRTLDLDLIAYGRLISGAAELALPHPRAAERRFVMGPLAEIAPRWRHPVHGREALELAQTAQVGRDAAPGPWPSLGVAQAAVTPYVSGS